MQFFGFWLPICNPLKCQRKSPPEREGLRKISLFKNFGYSYLLFLACKLQSVIISFSALVATAKVCRDCNFFAK